MKVSMINLSKKLKIKVFPFQEKCIIFPTLSSWSKKS